MRCPFSLFKKKSGKGFVWYVRFWDSKAKKKERKREASVYLLCASKFRQYQATYKALPYIR